MTSRRARPRGTGSSQRRRRTALLAAALILLPVIAVLLARALRTADTTTDTSVESSAPEEAVRRRRRTVLVPGAVALLVVVLLSGLALGHTPPAEPATASPTTVAPHVAAVLSSRTHAYESLGPAWPEVRATLDDAVATARSQGFTLDLCVRALDTRAGESSCSGTGRERYAASTVKVPIAVAVLEKHLGRLDRTLPVRWQDIRGGSGTIKDDGPGDYTIGELVRRSLVVSDNTATVVLLRDLGSVAAANRPTRRLSPVPAFTVANFSGALPDGGSDAGVITARGAADYLTELARCERDTDCVLTSPEIARLVLGHLREQQIVTKIGLHLDPGGFATKGGDMDFVSHDIGIVETGHGEVVLTAVSTASDPAYPDPIIAAAARDVVGALE